MYHSHAKYVTLQLTWLTHKNILSLSRSLHFWAKEQRERVKSKITFTKGKAAAWLAKAHTAKEGISTNGQKTKRGGGKMRYWVQCWKERGDERKRHIHTRQRCRCLLFVRQTEWKSNDQNLFSFPPSFSSEWEESLFESPSAHFILWGN